MLAVLLLRGPQTPGELKARTERIARLESLAEVERVLTALGERDYARRLERRPGQKEDRFEHLLGGRGDWEASAPPPAPAPVAPAYAQTEPAPPPVPAAPRVDVDGALAQRIEVLESEVASLRAELDELREQLTAPAAH